MTADRKVVVAPSRIHGLGVFTTERIAEGDTVLVIDDSRTVDADHPLRAELGEYPYHCDYLEHGRVVLMASPERHINSSCDPNTWVKCVGTERHVIARRTVTAGEEITYDYVIDCHRGQPWQCHCGSPRCLGLIPASVFDLRLDRLCERLPYLSRWFIAEHHEEMERARQRCRAHIDSQHRESS